MPTSRAVRAITRREGLFAAALILPVGLIAACSSSDDAATGSGSASSTAASSGTVDAGTMTQDVASEESALITLYDAALSVVPDTDARHAVLASIRDQHAAHLESLGVTADTGVAAEPLPSDADAVLSVLARAEHAAARSRIRACEEAADATLARLLVFIAASESSHAAELRRARA